MRLWSLHPHYLDRMGFLAVWREGLLALKVLQGNTKGYRNHPQLQRFKAAKDPMASISWYLRVIAKEAQKRGYRFDITKVNARKKPPQLPVTRGQIGYEFNHLSKKLQKRDPQRYESVKSIDSILPHPLFYEVEGPVELWEKVG